MKKILTTLPKTILSLLPNIIVFSISFFLFLVLPSQVQAQPQECSGDAPNEIIPSCIQCQDILFCYGNGYRRCATDPKIPSACREDEPDRNWWCEPSLFPSGTVLYNGVRFTVPSGGVHVCKANVSGCNDERCRGGGGGPPNVSCHPSIVQDTTSRPAYACFDSVCECDACNYTNYLEPSCATAFKVSTTLEYQRKDGEECGGQHWIDKTWTGTVRIDPSEVQVPFAGKKGEESEEKYLADWLEGTNEFYPKNTKDNGLYWRDWIDHAGILRKLTPMEYQDQLKKEVVQRAVNTIETGGVVQEEAIHDYKLEYVGRICWDIPLAADAFIAFLKRLDLPGTGTVLEKLAQYGHYCAFDGSLFENFTVGRIEEAIIAFNAVSPFDIVWRRTLSESSAKLADFALDPDKRLPPDSLDEDYLKKREEWRNLDKNDPKFLQGRWASLWQTVPMFSREDTFDEIIPYAGLRPNVPEETFTITQTDRPEFPHLARLYEAAEELQKLFIPAQGLALTQNSQGVIIAQANCELPSPTGVNLCQWPAITDPNPNDPICCDPIVAQLTARDKFVNQCYTECIYDWICGPDPVCTDPDCPDYVFAAKQPSQSYTLASQPADQNRTLAASYLAQAGEPCLYCENCEGSATKTHQCHGTIQDGVCKFDSAVSPACTPCQACGNGTCDVCEGADWCPQDCAVVECHWGIINPCCLKQETQPVSRMIGIDLQIPYVGGIWEKTAGLPLGLFNIFRVHEQENFPEMPATSDKPVRYYFTSSEDGSVEPSEGQFYFPYLGGVQIGKNWVVRAIWPLK